MNDIQSRCCKVQSIKNFFRKAIYLAKFDMSKSNTFTAQNYCTPHVMLLTAHMRNTQYDTVVCN